MEAKLIVLKLFLEDLDIPVSIESIDDRKRVQKAVYLGQLSGVDLGYRFGWYLMGPYSPALTRDYYSLAEDIASGDRDAEDKELQPTVRDRLMSIAPLLTTPDDISLPQEDWLELLASVHYLRTVRHLDDDATRSAIREQKPHLYPWIDQAIEKLAKADLLS
jgi:hypothetical protein